jgi:hypothetical protein
MPVKVSELKDDAIVDIQVNKNYYLMTKASLAYLFKLNMDKKEEAENLEEIKSKEYNDMSDFQRSFYTLSLLLAEIERCSKQQEKTIDTEVLVPGDEGYVAPIQD